MHRFFLLSACSAVVVVAQSPARAQDQASVKSTMPSDPDHGSSDIIVTARKSEERAQEVPIALTVASGGELSDRSIRGLSEVAQLAPAMNVTSSSQTATGVYYSSRGVAVSNTRLTTDPGVGLYIDGVNIPRTFGIQASELYDIDRIEVLAGPQGTLYGKNNTGGAINYYTTLPKPELGGGIRLRAATAKEVSGAAILNVPLAENISTRFVGMRTYRDGYGEDLVSDADYGRLDSWYGRGTLLWEVTPGFTATVRGDYTDVYATLTAAKGGTELVAPGLAEVARALGYTNAQLADPAIAAAVIAAYTNLQNGDPQDGVTDLLSGEKVRHWGTSLTLDLDITSDISLKSITSYRKVDANGAIDLDGSPFQLLQFSEHFVDAKNVTQELQLSGRLLDGRATWIVGGYYANETGHERLRQIGLGLLSAARGPTIQEGTFGNKTYAFYGQTTAEVLPNLHFTGGLRYTKDMRSLTVFNRDLRSCNALGVPLALLGGAPCQYKNPGADFTAVSYTAGLDYRIARNIMAYIRYDRGYRTGGLPIEGGTGVSPAAARGSFQPFGPEFARNLELGFKSQFLDNRVLLNVSAFRVRYSGLQRTAAVAIPGTNPPQIFSFTANAASAEVKGIEALASVKPFRGLELTGSLSLLDPKYTSFIDPGTGVDRSNEPFPLVVKTAYTLGASYKQPIGDALVGLRGDYYWQDATPAAVSGPDISTRPAFGILNLRLNAAFERDGLDLAIFAKNVTDKQVGMNPINLRSTLGINLLGNSNPPRQIGVELTKSF